MSHAKLVKVVAENSKLIELMQDNIDNEIQVENSSACMNALLTELMEAKQQLREHGFFAI